jgi:4-hydroxy 2-oxovalerate aldolase
VAFIDFGMYNFNLLPENDGTSIDGIRVGFTKKDFDASKESILWCLRQVKSKGYKLFVQGVNTLGYTDAELISVIDMVNEVEPYSFGIVDTYGAMYIDDLQRIYTIVDHNLKSEIHIDFHSHNNFQLSFSLAQEIIKLSRGNRKVIIDSTLNGMGKVAGNLNTELIVDYMNRKMGYNYDYDQILDLIDEYIYKYKVDHEWGYSIPGVMAGIYKSHPNNIIYLTDKFRLDTKDIKYILSMISPETRQKYDYDNIQEVYRKYNHVKVDDSAAIQELKENLEGKDLLLLFPGKSLRDNRNIVEAYISKKAPIIITVNFIPDFIEKDKLYAFFGSEKRLNQYEAQIQDCEIILASNIKANRHYKYVINYESIVEREEDGDNTGIMLLNLLRRLGCQKFAIAGFDGFDTKSYNYVYTNQFDEFRFANKYEGINQNLMRFLQNYVKTMDDKEQVTFLTPSIFEGIFNK